MLLLYVCACHTRFSSIFQTVVYCFAAVPLSPISIHQLYEASNLMQFSMVIITFRVVVKRERESASVGFVWFCSKGNNLHKLFRYVGCVFGHFCQLGDNDKFCYESLFYSQLQWTEVEWELGCAKNSSWGERERVKKYILYMKTEKIWERRQKMGKKRRTVKVEIKSVF